MKSNPIPEKIVDFIYRHHVVSIACHSLYDFWAANCFYAFDLAEESLIILTERNTRHGQLMLNYPIVAGTIAAQPKEIQDIEGMQFRAKAKLLTGDEQVDALRLYFTTHAIAKGRMSDVWAIYLSELKYTENRTEFAQKYVWNRKTAE